MQSKIMIPDESKEWFLKNNNADDFIEFPTESELNEYIEEEEKQKQFEHDKSLKDDDIDFMNDMN